MSLAMLFKSDPRAGTFSPCRHDVLEFVPARAASSIDRLDHAEDAHAPIHATCAGFIAAGSYSDAARACSPLLFGDVRREQARSPGRPALEDRVDQSALALLPRREREGRESQRMGMRRRGADRALAPG